MTIAAAHHHYGVTAPPRECAWGLLWTGSWWDRKVQLFVVHSATRRVEEKDRCTHYVLLGGTGYVQTDDRDIRALPDAPIAVAPRTHHRLVSTGQDPARWLAWYSDDDSQRTTPTGR